MTIMKMFPFYACVFVLVVIVLLFFSACGSLLGSDQGGEGGTVLHLSVPADVTLLCTQGAGGSYSHQGTSTLHDVDLDTSNAVNEEVYAPIGGIAFVHLENATSNFGYHVNIDLGDGTYVVLAHFKDVFVSDGAEVAAGQLLGYEGCTGNCSGDHVHLGLHQGDASQQAQYGTSIEATYYTEDATENDGFSERSGDDFVCGVAGEGSSSGHWYRSALPVTRWHPNGMLIKPPDGTAVYLLEDGKRRWIETEEVFWSLGYQFADVAIVANEEISCYEEGPALSEEGMTDAVFDDDGTLWLIVGSQTQSDRYRIRVSDLSWEAVLASWGLSYAASDPPATVTDSHAFLTAWPVREGTVRFRDGSLVKEAGSSAVYAISDGVAAPIETWETYLLLGFHDRQILTVEDGHVEAIQEEVGNCTADLRCLTSQAVTTCGGGFELGSGEEGGSGTGGQTTGTPTPSPCTDKDGDGFCNEATGGTDCWDSNADVHPGSLDLCGDGIDQDCSGTDLSCAPDETDTDGDLVVDTQDNCPFADNFDQSDLDGDGLGDSCDLDMDGDGANNATDCDMLDPTVEACGGPNGEDPSSEVTPTPTPEETDDPQFTPTPDDSTDSPDPSSGPRTIAVSWTTPFGQSAERITLAGAYVFEEGSYGFTWRTLVSVSDASTITYALAGVSSGDQFRFSVEYVDAMGTVSWSCIAPYPPGTLQGTPKATVDGVSLAVQTTDDPASEGCGLLVEIP